MSVVVPPVVRGPDELTPRWMTSVLHGSGALLEGARVAGLHAEPIGAGGLADTVRVHLAVEPPDAGPTSVVAKFASSDATYRRAGTERGAYEAEVGFYATVADRVAARVPRCHAAVGGTRASEGWFTLVLDDTVGARPGEPLDGCSPAAAIGALAELAAVHAPAWAAPDLAPDTAAPRHRWLHRPGLLSEQAGAVLARALPGFLDHFGDRLEPAHVTLCQRFVASLSTWQELCRPDPATVVHGDFRGDHLLFVEGELRPWVVAWQAAAWGVAALDVAYFVGGSLTPEVRRAHERDLVASYLDALGRRGVVRSTAAFALEYRRWSFAGLAVAIGAVVAGAPTERRDAMVAVSAARHATHVLDLAADELLGAPGRA